MGPKVSTFITRIRDYMLERIFLEQYLNVCSTGIRMFRSLCLPVGKKVRVRLRNSSFRTRQ